MKTIKNKKTKIILIKKNNAMKKYEEYLKVYEKTNSERGELGKGLRELSEIQGKLIASTPKNNVARICWPTGGNSEPPLIKSKIKYELEPTLIYKTSELYQDSQNHDTWHGTIQNNGMASLCITRDFSPFFFLGKKKFTGKFHVCPSLSYGGIADFGKNGRVIISAETQAQLLDNDYINEHGFLTDPKGMLGLWRSSSTMTPETYYTYANSCTMPIPGKNFWCDVTCDCGAVSGTTIRIAQSISMDTSGAVVSFDGLGFINMPTPELTMWVLESKWKQFPVIQGAYNLPLY